MRRIISKSDHAKKQRRNNLIMGIGLIVIMFISVVGYGLMGRDDESSSSGNKIIFRGFEFDNINNLWVTQINDLQFIFRNDPREVISIEGQVNYANVYSGKPLYLSSEDEGSTIEIASNFNQIAQRIQEACTEDEICEDDLPIKDCANNFIIIRESNETSVVQNASCVFIQGEKDNLLNITDGFLLKVMGISN